jgi:hypothetical protein
MANSAPASGWLSASPGSRKLHVDVTYSTFMRDGDVTTLSLRQSAEPMPESGRHAWRSIEGFRIGEDRRTSPVGRTVRTRRDGTHVELSSAHLPLERLLEMARTLVPLPSR